MRDVLHGIWHGLRAIGGVMRTAGVAFAKFWADVVRAILPDRQRRDEDEDEEDDDDDEDEEVEEDDVLEASDDEHEDEPEIITRKPNPIEVVELLPAEKKKRGKKDKTEIDLPVVEADAELAPEAAPATAKKKQRLAAGTEAPPLAAAMPPAEATDHAGPVIFEPKFQHADKAAMAMKEKAAEQERQQSFIKLGDGDYQLPSIQLLNYDASSTNAIDKTAMLELSAKLTQTLENYAVKGDVVAIRPGPVVTMYEFAPAPGTRVNKIVNLTDDLSLALEALRVRIVAPIPGKAAVGIEVPNKAREMVFLKEILADDMFRKGKAKLPMAIGKDIEGGPSVVDLARMPHLLVAGTTGSGKSVAVNAMITSLLYHC
jgi:S-DNA-T family DNA segregation ATPase FtsK/SpoIIIE